MIVLLIACPFHNLQRAYRVFDGVIVSIPVRVVKHRNKETAKIGGGHAYSSTFWSSSYRDLMLLEDVAAIHSAKSVKRFNPLSFLTADPDFVSNILDEIRKSGIPT